MESGSADALPLFCRFAPGTHTPLSLNGTDIVCEDVEDLFREAQETEHPQCVAISHIERVSDVSLAESLLWETLHCEYLVELNLERSNLVELFDQLQFWGVPNVQKLTLDNTNITLLPASIGRLRDLTVLSLKDNRLSSLPSTLSFCSKLKELHLQNNIFHVLPGVILHLNSLEILNRHGNRLSPTSADLASRARRNEYIWVAKEKKLQEDGSELGVVVPLTLLAVQEIMTSSIDYWDNVTVAPAICKVIDLAQSEYKICGHCHAAKRHKERGFRVKWLLESYVGLKHLPLEHFACSSPCATALERGFKQIQVKLIRESHEKYQRELEQCLEAQTQASIDGTQAKRRKKPKEITVDETWRMDFIDNQMKIEGRNHLRNHLPRSQQQRCALL